LPEISDPWKAPARRERWSSDGLARIEDSTLKTAQTPLHARSQFEDLSTQIPLRIRGKLADNQCPIFGKGHAPDTRGEEEDLLADFLLSHVSGGCRQ
jgi:hypothetical protein